MPQSAALPWWAARSVLIEERNEKNGLLSGRTASSIIVEFPGEDEWIGEFKNVKVTEARNWILRGECVD